VNVEINLSNVGFSIPLTTSVGYLLGKKKRGRYKKGNLKTS
jgi:hypothetical protein